MVRVAGLVVDACGLLDSILRQVSLDPSVIDDKPKAKDNLNITDYAKLYAASFELPSLVSSELPQSFQRLDCPRFWRFLPTAFMVEHTYSFSWLRGAS